MTDFIKTYTGERQWNEYANQYNKEPKLEEYRKNYSDWCTPEFRIATWYLNAKNLYQLTDEVLESVILSLYREGEVHLARAITLTNGNYFI